VVSFADLVAPPAAPDCEPSLLVVGGVEYDAPGAVAPTASSAAPVDRSSGPVAGFAPLLQTRFEAQSVGALFEEAFDREPVLLLRDAATKAALHDCAPAARYLHVATHGWYAPESVPSMADAGATRMGAGQTVVGFVPMALCGLALAGANRGRDDLGRVPGILTAEELCGYDLSGCALAVLSGCETSVGMRRAGQGQQSLQAALHAAGARAAVTSLWRVDDAATRRLMELFYEGLWVDGAEVGEALWRAKVDLRREGAPTRDWAGWVLTGTVR
jgi:CHAT domain-containing protein